MVAGICVPVVAGVITAGTGLALVLVALVPHSVLLSARRSLIDRLGLPARWAGWLAQAVAEKEAELEEAIRPRRGRPVDVCVAVGALAVVVVASVAMEQGASALGVRYGIPEIVVGALLLAAVTSLPNAVAAVYLARRGRGAATFSTALNSNNINVTAGLLIPATVIGVSQPTSSGLLVAGWYLGLTTVTLLLAYAFRGRNGVPVGRSSSCTDYSSAACWLPPSVSYYAARSLLVRTGAICSAESPRQKGPPASDGDHIVTYQVSQPEPRGYRGRGLGAALFINAELVA